MSVYVCSYVSIVCFLLFFVVLWYVKASSHSESAEGNVAGAFVTRPFAAEVKTAGDEVSVPDAPVLKKPAKGATAKAQKATQTHGRSRTAKRARSTQLLPPMSTLPRLADCPASVVEGTFAPPAIPLAGYQQAQPACRSHLPSTNFEKPNHWALPRTDDADGHLVYCLGDGVCPTPDFPQGRYKILSDLGEGTFGKVVECWDRREAFRVAIKIVRSVAKYRDAARLEIEVLEHLESNDSDGRYHCVRMLGWFEYQGHVCIVFEKLGPSLYEQLRRSRFQPFSIEQVRDFAYQLLESVHFVHSLTLIHTDLKPENILFADPDTTTASAAAAAAAAAERAKEAAAAAALAEVEAASKSMVEASAGPASERGLHGTEYRKRLLPVSMPARNSVTTSATPPQTPPARALRVVSPAPATAIKLIDFGSATFESHHHSAVISTRHYRAPEVILGLGWTYPCDLWSIGCILVELYTGQALFQTHENLEHLAMMHVVLGPIPDSMICRADRYSQKYFTPAVNQSSRVQERPCLSDRPPSGTSAVLGDCVGVRNAIAATRDDGIWRQRVGNGPIVHTEDVRSAGGGMRARPLRAGCELGARGQTTAGALSTASASGSVAGGGYGTASGVAEGTAQRSSRTLNWPAGASSVASVKAVRRVKSLADIVKGSEFHANFLDLLHQLLEFEPDKRCTAADALSHPFFFPCVRRNRGATPTVSSGGESSICASHATLGGYGGGGASELPRVYGGVAGQIGGSSGPSASKRESGVTGRGGPSGRGGVGEGATDIFVQSGYDCSPTRAPEAVHTAPGHREFRQGCTSRREAFGAGSCSSGAAAEAGEAAVSHIQTPQQAVVWDVMYRPMIVYGGDPAVAASMPPPAASLPLQQQPGTQIASPYGSGGILAPGGVFATPAVLRPAQSFAPYVPVPHGAYSYRPGDGAAVGKREASSRRPEDQAVFPRSIGRTDARRDIYGMCDLSNVAGADAVPADCEGTEICTTPGGELSDVTFGPGGQLYGPDTISLPGAPRPQTGSSCVVPPRGYVP